jgi:tousled-like kinase
LITNTVRWVLLDFAALQKLKDMEDQEQLRGQKRLKAVSDLLISVGMSERQEACTRLQQDCIKLGNLTVMRTRTVLSEVWEDGPAFKDIQNRL